MLCLHEVMKTTQALRPLIALLWAHIHTSCACGHIAFAHMWPHLTLQLLCSSWVSGGAFNIFKLTLNGFSSQEPAIFGTADLETTLKGLPVSSDSGSSYLLIGVVQPEGLFTQRIICRGWPGRCILNVGPML